MPRADARLRVQEVHLTLLSGPLLCEQTPGGTIGHSQCEKKRQEAQIQSLFMSLCVQ